MLEDKSRIRYIDRQEDVILVEDNAEYVCLMKLFPMCGTKKLRSEDDYRRFHMRFYIPQEYFHDGGRKIHRIIIMTNGLDEFKDYRLYDQLGSRLASIGLPAVLLPLPDHLNRHVRYRHREPRQDETTSRPFHEIFKEPMVLHERFLQYKRELAQLLNHISKQTRKRACNKPESQCSFYSHFFADKVRVSYFGFSLGGATMLCDFLDSQERLNACVLLNPAIKLPVVDGRRLRLKPEDWKDFVIRLLRAYDDYKGLDKNRSFGEILLGRIVDAPEKLSEYRQRLLFIYGGADDFTSHANSTDITPRETGSGTFIIPGVKHLIADDEEWQKWSTLTVQLISDVEVNAARQVITKEDLKRFQSSKGVTNESSKEEFRKSERWYRPSLLKVPQDMAARDEEEKRVEKHIQATPLEDLRLGEMLRKKQLVSFQELYDVLAEQRCSDLKIGDIAADVFRIVSREQVNELLGKQRRSNDELELQHQLRNYSADVNLSRIEERDAVVLGQAQN